MKKFYVKTEMFENGEILTMNQSTLDLESLTKDLNFQTVDRELVNLNPEQKEELKTKRKLTITTNFTKVVTIVVEK